MIVELRQYVMQPGGRDTLIGMFDTIFIDAQEACGIEVIGVFRDLDDPNRFVWFRRFPDMESRQKALECFYNGALWKANRDAANTTMIDSDDVLLLRELHQDVVDIAGEGELFVSIFERNDAIANAALETEHSPNTFPRLPIRENEDVLVTFARSQQIPENSLPYVKQRLRLSATSRSKMG